MRILSLDGGGVKGIMPATILAYLEQELQQEAERWQVAERDKCGKLYTMLQEIKNHYHTQKPLFAGKFFRDFQWLARHAHSKLNEYLFCCVCISMKVGMSQCVQEQVCKLIQL